MTEALEGTAVPEPTLREQANARRIGRGRFIGNAIGVLLLFALLTIGLSFTPLGHPLPGPPDAPSMRVLSPLPLLIVCLIALLVLTDLMVRRRHDRNRSGVDAAAFAVLASGVLIAQVLGKVPDIGLYLDAALGLYGLYLLVVLLLLPGTKGSNGYGADPRTLVRDGH